MEFINAHLETILALLGALIVFIRSTQVGARHVQVVDTFAEAIEEASEQAAAGARIDPAQVKAIIRDKQRSLPGAVRTEIRRAVARVDKRQVAQKAGGWLLRKLVGAGKVDLLNRRL